MWKEGLEVDKACKGETEGLWGASMAWKGGLRMDRGGCEGEKSRTRLL